MKGQVKMKFNEDEFQKLVTDTRNKVIKFGTYSKSVLASHEKYAKSLKSFLKENDSEFSFDVCKEWLDSMEHDTASQQSYSYCNWVGLKRYIHLMADECSGKLVKWKVYSSNQMAWPQTDGYKKLAIDYDRHLEMDGFADSTIYHRLEAARLLLIYFEKIYVFQIEKVTNSDVAQYFSSEHFRNRKPAGIQAEARSVRLFLLFLEDCSIIINKLLHYAVPIYNIHEEKIITIITPLAEKAILQDFPEYSANKREKAQYLLALHLGLRTCDIYNIRFCDLYWDEGVLTVTQQKTNKDFRMKIDNETQNAIIDYILNERRDCDSEYIFLTAVGPIHRLNHRKCSCYCRIRDIDIPQNIPHDGLHILRRTYASKLLACGTAMPVISAMLGHTDKKSVQCYLSTDEKKMRSCALDLKLIPFTRREF